MNIDTENFTFVSIMVRLNEKWRQVAGLFLEALMLIFVFNFSWSEVNYTNKHSNNELAFSATQVEEITFYDSDSSSESIINVLSKPQISHSIQQFSGLDLFAINLFNIEECFVNRSLYNIFYRHITASAP